MRNKESNLLQDIKTYTKQKNFYKNQAKFAKYASIFATTGASIAAVAAIINTIEAGRANDNTWGLIMGAISFALIANAAHDTKKNTNRIAKRYRNKIQKRKQALKKLHKTR